MYVGVGVFVGVYEEYGGNISEVLTILMLIIRNIDRGGRMRDTILP